MKKYDLEVRLLDINAGNHLSNDKVLSYLTEVNAKFFLDLGCSIDNIFGSTFVVTDVYVSYKKEVTYPSTLTIFIEDINIEKLKINIKYTVKLNDLITHKAKIEGVLLDNLNKKVCRPNATILEIINGCKRQN